ncbi:MAG: helix-turn-helix transcriptional regulator [Romboutsia sp.]|jgi:DNA-binding XRE family transcriptional regulator|nr:MAG TPA: helix-turn-helix domain protein [Caudoviricetes sp.]
MIVKSYRKFYNLTQSDMADKLGITLQNYYQKENGIREFKLSEAKKIADLFGVSIEDIFFTNEVNKMITKKDKVKIAL